MTTWRTRKDPRTVTSKRGAEEAYKEQQLQRDLDAFGFNDYRIVVSEDLKKKLAKAHARMKGNTMSIREEMQALLERRSQDSMYTPSWIGIKKNVKSKKVPLYTAMTLVNDHMKRNKPTKGDVDFRSNKVSRKNDAVAFWDGKKWRATSKADADEKKTVAEINGARGYTEAKKQMYAVYMITWDDELEAVTQPMASRAKAMGIAKKMTKKNRKPYVVHGAGYQEGVENLDEAPLPAPFALDTIQRFGKDIERHLPKALKLSKDKEERAVYMDLLNYLKKHRKHLKA